MPKEPQERKEIAQRPASPGITTKTLEQWKPEQLDPELANLAMAKLLIDKLGTPSRVKKEFIVRKAVFTALNHIPCTYEEIEPMTENEEGFKGPAIWKEICKGNPTGYDSSLRLEVYHQAELGSVNEDGIYFDRAWAFLMKPKYIINGMGGMGQLEQEEEGESLVGKAINWFRGRKSADNRNNTG